MAIPTFLQCTPWDQLSKILTLEDILYPSQWKHLVVIWREMLLIYTLGFLYISTCSSGSTNAQQEFKRNNVEEELNLWIYEMYIFSVR